MKQPCLECGRILKGNGAAGLCITCYGRHRRRRLGMAVHLPSDRPCIECGASPVTGHGLCKACYMRKYRAANRDRPRQYKNKLREIDRFGGRRNEIEAQARGKCERCGVTEAAARIAYGTRLHVHHRDGNGLISAHPNHAIENLALLCPPCHKLTHDEMRKAVSA